MEESLRCVELLVMRVQSRRLILLKGLETLEYRGYDSAGMAVMSDGVINIQKCRGRLAALAEKQIMVKVCKDLLA